MSGRVEDCYPVRWFGKALVAVGLFAAIALAIAAPIAFTLEAAPILLLLEIAGGGILVSLLLVKLGDLIADSVVRRRDTEPVGVLPQTREPRDRSLRSHPVRHAEQAPRVQQV
ncbi:hypothetical protein G7077_08905 [Sphingomonas piscis]|uniref:Uncharacterized protein n=1 Tax=Sphingomonas piscis TaxID=2714943 RepID=A0A6G7YQJ0_9SPHN|nr:hypothetical protein [Sphingomonas piscis]QIK78997.1 hypothetical protein G7077_08905 [Sphingomonas piscis]